MSLCKTAIEKVRCKLDFLSLSNLDLIIDGSFSIKNYKVYDQIVKVSDLILGHGWDLFNKTNRNQEKN